MLADDTFDWLVAMRVKEYFDRRTPWTRRLWQFGTYAHLHELLAAVQTGAPISALEEVAGAARRAVELDYSLESRTRGVLLSAIPTNRSLPRFLVGSYAEARLREAVLSFEPQYLTRWVDIVGASTAPTNSGATQNPDLVARLLAGHLLSSGFSPVWIVNHFSYYLRRAPDVQTLAGVLDIADRIREKGKGPYTFLVPLVRSPRIHRPSSLPWLRKQDFEERYGALFPDAEVPSHRGGLELTIEALDKYTAQGEFLRELVRLQTRTVAASRKRSLVFGSTAWMAPGGGTVLLDEQPEIQFIVPALDQDGGRALFSPISPEVDSALDMLVALNSEHDRTACVNAWAALESLFAGPGDFGNFVEVTHRAAAVVTCSYLHREISGLGHAHQRKASDELTSQLGRLEGSAWLAAIIDYVKSGGKLEDDRELAAINQARVQRLVMDTRNIDDLRLSIAETFGRLYRTRNTIVHYGESAPYGMSSVVAAARVLLSGLLDRVVVRSRDDKLGAALVAAKAELALARILQGDDLSLVEGL